MELEELPENFLLPRDFGSCSAQKATTKQGEMKAARVNEAIMEIFEVTGFFGILMIA